MPNVLEYTIVIWLSFMDGSMVKYLDEKTGEEPVMTGTIEQCLEKIDDYVAEMREDFKDHDPKPSTFIRICSEDGGL